MIGSSYLIVIPSESDVMPNRYGNQIDALRVVRFVGSLPFAAPTSASSVVVKLSAATGVQLEGRTDVVSKS